MLPALYDADRRSVRRLATMLIVGSVAVLPLTTQSTSVAGAADVRAERDETGVVVPVKLTFPAYSVGRDPFVPEDSIRAKLARDALSVAQTSGIGIVLPPNAGAMQSGPIPAMSNALPISPVVRAVVLGNPARALVEEGGSVRVLGIGDRVGGSTVEAITADGITLSDGTRLTIAVSHR
jgi:hypothetical protein